jgi:NADH-quinone oxidoreductase subunit J
MMADQILFWVTAAVLVVGALGVVGSKNLVHSVFWLALTLASTAVLFVLLQATFLAGIQIMLYTGGVMTLMLFGIMMTQRDAGAFVPNPIARTNASAAVSFTLFALLLSGIWGSPGIASKAPVPGPSAQEIGQLFLGPQLLSFEVLSVLLLAAMVGAILLARRTDA